MRRLGLALFLFVPAAPARSADNAAPQFFTLQVTDCNGNLLSSPLRTNIPNPSLRFNLQDSQSGLHVGQAPFIAGSSTPANTHLFWSFDVETSSAADDSGNGEHGIFQGSTGGNCPGQDPCFETAGGVSGAYGRQLHFVGNQPASDTVVRGMTVNTQFTASTASLQNLISFITIESWVRPDNLNEVRPFLEFSTSTGRAPQDDTRGPTIYFNTFNGTTHTGAVDSGRIWVNFISSGSPSPGIVNHVVVSTPVLKSGLWHLLAVTYDRSLGAGHVYVDGVMVASQTLGAFALRTDGDLRIGYSSGTPRAYASPFQSPSFSFQGRIDQFRILAKAISATEAQQDYEGGRLTLRRAGQTVPEIYLPRIGPGGWTDGDTGVFNFNQTVSAITGGPNLSLGTNQLSLTAADRAGNITQFGADLTYQTSAPGTPTMTSIGPSGSGQIVYSWTQPPAICTGQPPQYRIYDCATPTENLITTITGVLTNTENTPPPDTNVKFGRKVQAFDDVLDIASDKSPCSQTYTNADPPTSLTPSSISTGSLVLTWNPGINPNYTRYALQRFPTAARVAGQEIQIIQVQDGFVDTTRGISGLDPGTTYFFRVFAVSGRADDLEVLGGNPTGPADLDVATRVGVSTITGRAVNSTTIQWDWQQATGADRYRVVNSTDDVTILCQGTEDALCTAPGGHCVCNAGGYTPDTRVSAYLIAAGPPPAPEGERSNVAAVFTHALQPTGFAVTSVTSNTVSLSWGLSGNSPTTNYEIRRSTSQTMFGVISTASAQGTAAVLGGLLPASTYFFQLRARNGDEVFTAPDVNVRQAVTNPAVGISASSGPATTYEAPAGAMAIWHFDESTGTRAFDTTPNRHDGLLTCSFAGCISTPTFAAGPDGLGTAVRFIGQSDSFVHVSTSPIFDALPGLTIEAWLNPSTAFQVPEAAVIAKGSSTDYGFSLDVDNSGAVSRWRLRVGTGQPGNACGVGAVCLTS
ncbi:MAG: fibronectin type III domain-containing protein, partial [Elusimicrobia bacterium]|nr:fibronectin type III domain-containing protein [Elusimicrobiota bacterium]